MSGVRRALPSGEGLDFSQTAAAVGAVIFGRGAGGVLKSISVMRDACVKRNSKFETRNWLPRPASRWIPQVDKPLRGTRSKQIRNSKSEKREIRCSFFL